jgi:hypothetical protein
VDVVDPIAQLEMKSVGRARMPGPTNNLGAKVYENFAITDDAAIFFIGQGMWLPEVSGPVEVSVPRAEIESLLA